MKSSDLIEKVEFLLRFHIEHQNPRIKGALDFLSSLTHAGEDNSFGVRTRLEDPIELPDRDDIEPSSFLREYTQDSQV